MKKACIVGASKINDASFLQKRKDCYLISCDGGYLCFLNQGMEPDLFIGDFDTLDKDSLHHPKEVIRLNPVKDDTDTIFAVKTALDRGFDTFYFYGCLGGKLEHTIANLQVLKYLKDREKNGYLIDEDNSQIVFMLHQEKVCFKKMKGMLSVFSYSETCTGVTIHGMKYELKESALTNSFPLGVSNQLIDNEDAFIEVKEGFLLVIAPLASLDL